ncbi:GNAT family N-acetyltransferase [Pseudomonadota bacterium]
MNKFIPEDQTNELGLTVGFPVDNWNGAESPGRSVLLGEYCRCEPLNLDKHSPDLFSAFEQDNENRAWVYLPYGPFDSLIEYQHWMKNACFNGDPFYYAIVDNKTDSSIGVVSYLRINPKAGSIEVGHINYSPALQRTVAATEAMYLMMHNAFKLGYRRYEWKCNVLNEKSCNAAKRLGFSYEGTFRQMLVVKGQNRDTAWFSILDREWPAVEHVFLNWLSPENFDATGTQIKALSTLTCDALKSINTQS